MKTLTCKNGCMIYPSAEGHFEEGGETYCERCYAEKRFSELKPSEVHAWFESTRAIIENADADTKLRFKCQMPSVFDETVKCDKELEPDPIEEEPKEA